jgi:hypothetical protein
MLLAEITNLFQPNAARQRLREQRRSWCGQAGYTSAWCYNMEQREAKLILAALYMEAGAVSERVSGIVRRRQRSRR